MLTVKNAFLPIAVLAMLLTSSAFGAESDKLVISFHDEVENVCSAFGCEISGMVSENVAATGELTGKMGIDAPTYDGRGNITDNGECDVRITFEEEIDAADNEYINVLLYSPQVTESKLAFGAYCTVSGALSSNNRRSGGVLIDFSGWRVISMRLSEFGSDMDWTKIKALRFSSNVYYKPAAQFGWLDETYVYIDRIWFSKEQVSDFSLEGCYPQNGSGDVPIIFPSVSFEFNNNLSDLSKSLPTAELLSGTERVSADISFTKRDKTLVASINERLAPDTEYTLNIGCVKDEYFRESSVTLSFKTAGGAIGCGIPYFMTGDETIEVLPSSGTVSANVSASNMSEKDKVCTLAFAAFDSSGNMLSIAVSSDGESVVPQNGQRVISVSLEMPENVASLTAFALGEDGATMFGSCSELSESGISHKAPFSGNYDLNTDLLTVETAPYIDKGEVFVSGKCGSLSYPVFFMIKSSVGELLAAFPIKVLSDGSFSYLGSVALSAGDYTYFVVTPKNKYVRDFYYISDLDMQMLTEKVNGAAALSDMRKLTAENVKSFNLGSVSESDIDSYALALYEGKPYADFSELSKRLTSASDILSSLKACIWSQLDAVISEGHDIILGNSSTYNYYSGLAANKRAVICEKLNKSLPITSLTEFRAAFSSAVDSYKETLSTKQYSGGGGSSGSKSGGVQYTLPKLQTNNDEKKAETKESEFLFEDLGSATWAADAIYALVSSGSIAKSEDKKFRPQDSITREEFLKLLITAEKLPLLVNGSKSFTDVTEDKWYFKYVNTAVEKGIISGYSDTLFGVGDYITRQDMCVILHRLSGSPSSATVNFSDFEKIAPYAAAAVSYAYSAGIIDGFEDGSFRATDTLSRAQAASVVYRFAQGGEL